MENDVLEDMKLALEKIDFYEKFPAMKPFLGDYYVSDVHKKLLFVGESFYLPNDTTLHHCPEGWYISNQNMLRKSDLAWINCNELLKLKNNWLPKSGHIVYIELNKCIKTTNINFRDYPIEEIAFTNYFLRPAEKEGDSLAKSCIPMDFEKANEALEGVIKVIKPDIVIFISKLAWSSCNSYFREKFPSIFFDSVAHPATGGLYWNKPIDEYGSSKYKLIQILKEKFVI